MWSRLGFPGRHLCHPPYATAPQPRVLVAVSPAIDCTLNEASLSAQARIQLRQGPSYSVAFCLIVQAISLVLIFCAACTRVDTVLGLKVLWKLIDINRFNIAADGVFHLYTIPRVLKSNPLYAILVLADDQRSGSRNRPRRSIGVHVWTSWGASMHVWCTNRRSLGSSLWWAES